MIRLPGGFNSDLCDTHATLTRRDLLRLGGSSILGLSLGQLLRLQASAATPPVTATTTSSRSAPAPRPPAKRSSGSDAPSGSAPTPA